jgi:hypothetical protein
MEVSNKYPQQMLKFSPLSSSKTTQTTKDRRLAAGTWLRTLGERNEEEKRHLNGLFSWAPNADPHEIMECFFVRSAPGEQYLLKRELVPNSRIAETTYNMGSAGRTTALLIDRAVVPIEHLEACALLGRKKKGRKKDA